MRASRLHVKRSLQIGGRNTRQGDADSAYNGGTTASRRVTAKRKIWVRRSVVPEGKICAALSSRLHVWFAISSEYAP